jgi:hypothetical protein
MATDKKYSGPELAEASKAILADVSIICRDDGYILISEFLQAGGKKYKHLAHDIKVKGRLSQLLHAEAAKVEISTLGRSFPAPTDGSG